MADIELVIKIPEEIKKKRDAGKVLSSEEIATVCMAIKNGASLPKGHGRLIDADAAKCSDCGEFGCKKVCSLYNASTIIEADGDVK